MHILSFSSFANFANFDFVIVVVSVDANAPFDSPLDANGVRVVVGQKDL